MTDLQTRSTDDVLQEIKRVGEVVDTARRVILVGGGHRSGLVSQLSSRLRDCGLVVTEAEPHDSLESIAPDKVGPLFKTFADILACPSLSHLFGDVVEPAPPAQHPLVSTFGDTLRSLAGALRPDPPAPEPAASIESPTLAVQIEDDQPTSRRWRPCQIRPRRCRYRISLTAAC